MIPISLDEMARAIGSAPVGVPVDVQPRRVSIDTRELQQGDLYVAIRGDRFDGHTFIADAVARGAVACVCDRRWFEAQSVDRAASAGVLIPVNDTVEALGVMASYYRKHMLEVGTVIVAITGSNGKTTTKCMLDHILSDSFSGHAAPRSFNNVIGVPLTLLAGERDHKYMIVEVGTNAPGEVAALAAIAQPHVGVMTSIGEAHLEGLGGIDGVAEEKMSLMRHVRSDGLAVVNTDCPQVSPYLRGMGASSQPRLVTIGSNPTAVLRVADVVGDLAHIQFRLEDRFTVTLPMPGLHHAANATAAFAVARWFGLPPEAIIERLATFVPPAGRTRVLRLGEITVVDDCYNANPSSMIAAIETFRVATKERRVFVMGDMLELGDTGAEHHVQVIEAALESGVAVLVTVGERSAAAAKSVGQRCGADVVSYADADVAADKFDSLLSPGDAVWIKGSRSVGLDRLVDRLRVRLDKCSAVA